MCVPLERSSSSSSPTWTLGLKPNSSPGPCRALNLILGTHIGTPRSEPEKVNSTLISPPEWGLTGFGRLDLTLRGGRIASYRLHTYNVSTAAPADPAVAAILNQAGIRPS